MILYKYPTRQRPHKFFEVLDNFMALKTNDDYMIICSCDNDDLTMYNEDVQKRLLDNPKYKNVIIFWGLSKGKVHSINRNLGEPTFKMLYDEYPATKDWKYLVLLSDDMDLQAGFDIEIPKAFEDGFSGLVHFPDGVVNERMCTFSVMDRAYYEELGYIYNPIYTSVYCDNEAHDVAVLTNRYKYIPVNIVKHLHPAYGHAPNDDLYRRNEHQQLYAIDGDIYQKRKSINFGILVTT